MRRRDEYPRPTGRVLGVATIAGRVQILPCRFEACGAEHFLLLGSRYDYAKGFPFDVEMVCSDGSSYLEAAKPQD